MYILGIDEIRLSTYYYYQNTCVKILNGLFKYIRKNVLTSPLHRYITIHHKPTKALQILRLMTKPQGMKFHDNTGNKNNEPDYSFIGHCSFSSFCSFSLPSRSWKQPTRKKCQKRPSVRVKICQCIISPHL